MIGVTETKLNGIIFDAEIYIEGYSIVLSDRDRKVRGVACDIKQDICFSNRTVYFLKNPNHLYGFVLPKTKPISIGEVCRPPKLIE